MISVWSVLLLDELLSLGQLAGTSVLVPPLGHRWIGIGLDTRQRDVILDCFRALFEPVYGLVCICISTCQTVTSSSVKGLYML